MFKIYLLLLLFIINNNLNAELLQCKTFEEIKDEKCVLKKPYLKLSRELDFNKGYTQTFTKETKKFVCETKDHWLMVSFIKDELYNQIKIKSFTREETKIMDKIAETIVFSDRDIKYQTCPSEEYEIIGKPCEYRCVKKDLR